jgi:hypothetical protein
MNMNTTYKDSVFTLLFSEPNKLRRLYNAVSNSSYGDETEIAINTLKNALYMNRINDISFIIDGKLIVLVEYQSTINENMPLRLLLYIARIYEKIIENKALYRRSLVTIPRPQFIVLYCGADPYPDRQTLRLSDAFAKVPGFDGVELELTVNVYNINYGHNPEILAKDTDLSEYAYFVEQVREYNKTFTLEEAVQKAIESCIRQGILSDFLTKNASEVVNMLFTEWNMEDAIAVAREEGEARGEARGRQQERSAMIELLRSGKPPEEILRQYDTQVGAALALRQLVVLY